MNEPCAECCDSIGEDDPLIRDPGKPGEFARVYHARCHPLVRAAVKAERERCAEIADDEALYIEEGEMWAARRIAEAIRDPECHSGLTF